MQRKLLLLEDIDHTKRKGDVIRVKPGYARNYLIPKKKAVFIDKRTLRLQERLKEERAKQAIEDKKQNEKFAQLLKGKVYDVIVKVDPDGHMYGSVSSKDIVTILANEKVEIDRRSIKLIHPIKKIGVHKVELHLKEGVIASFCIQVKSDQPIVAKKEAKVDETAKQESTDSATDEEEKPSSEES